MPERFFITHRYLSTRDNRDDMIHHCSQST
jgi:hypothetical protein